MDDLAEAGASMKRSREAHELEPSSLNDRGQLEHQLIYTGRKIIILTDVFLAAATAPALAPAVG